MSHPRTPLINVINEQDDVEMRNDHPSGAAANVRSSRASSSSSPMPPQPPLSVPSTSSLIQASTSSSSSQSKLANNNSGTIDSKEKEFQNYTAAKVKGLFDALRKETEEIEQNIGLGEEEVLSREQMAFLMRRHDLAIANLIAAHSTDLQRRKESLERILVARSERKKAKKEARKTIRASKRRDLIIQKQEISAETVARIRDTIGEKRIAYDLTTQHLINTHEKQRKNLLQSQDRMFANEKLLVDLETRHLKEEVRSTLMKKFQVRQNHLGHLNKRINDNLREIQLMDLRHSKEKFELEMLCFEEVESKKNLHVNQTADMKTRHLTELQMEKENVMGKKESAKEALLQKQHLRELKRLSHDQRIELKQLRLKHERILENCLAGNGSQIGSVIGSKIASIAGSAIGSKNHSRSGSAESMHSVESRAGVSSLTSSGRKAQSGKFTDAMIESELEADEGNDERVDTIKLNASVVALQKRHLQEFTTLEDSIRKEIADCQLAFDVKFSDLSEGHESARIKLLEDQDRDLEEMRTAQEKEIKIEEMMHDSEMKMLIERRILNSVLQTVADGIINITPQGIIVRFNHAAEVIFGYTPAEVIGQNITMLMPERFAVNHHTYLENYLTTGVKKAIGIGRRVFGLRKNGEEFPLHLSVSELKEDDEHLFTGIARDLTHDVQQEEAHERAQELKKKELETLVSELDSAKGQADRLLSQMLPPTVSKALLSGKKVAPQSFKSATVFFMDVVGFTTISAMVKPLEVVSLLNSLYSVIDRVIELYDVYKVETIGDSYMIVSGLPTENDHHATEICTMALHLMYAIGKFQFKKNPEIKIKVRMGVNTGPVVAGVVGSKMPRYCLFGDTVNTASRMESTGMATKIQVSETTAVLLRKSGAFDLVSRGEIDVKGKGKMLTHFIEGKAGFDPRSLDDKIAMSTEVSLADAMEGARGSLTTHASVDGRKIPNN